MKQKKSITRAYHTTGLFPVFNIVKEIHVKIQILIDEAKENHNRSDNDNDNDNDNNNDNDNDTTAD